MPAVDFESILDCHQHYCPVKKLSLAVSEAVEFEEALQGSARSSFWESNYLQAGALDSSVVAGAAAAVEAEAAVAVLVASAAKEGAEEVELAGFEPEALLVASRLVALQLVALQLVASRLVASRLVASLLEALPEALRLEEQSEH